MATLRTVIDSVNIFRNGAEVIRKGETYLLKGTQLLYVYGFSSTAIKETARIYSSESVSCGDLRFIADEEIGKELNKTSSEINDLNKQIEVRQLQIKLWESNGDFSARNDLPIEQVRRYIDDLPNQILVLQGHIKMLKVQIADLEKRKAELEKQNNPIIVCEVNSAKGGNYAFELRYHENNALWDPAYEIHAKESEPLKILMKGKIRQFTYENWNNVKVSLFTGDPSLESVYAKPMPVYLDIREDNVLFNDEMMAGSAENAQLAALDNVDVNVPGPNRKNETQTGHNEMMSEFSLVGRRDILSGEEGNIAKLKVNSIGVAYQIVSSPRINPNVFLIARIRKADLPFSGVLNAGIYLKGVYTGNIDLDLDKEGEMIDLTLGKEEQVHVYQRETVNKTTDAAANNLRMSEYVYETALQNLADEEKEVTLVDQIPVSRSRSIIVETADLEGAYLDQNSGIIQKKIRLKGKEIRKFKLAYRVSWPKNRNIRESRPNMPTFCPNCGMPLNSRICPNCGYKAI